MATAEKEEVWGCQSLSKEGGDDEEQMRKSTGGGPASEQQEMISNIPESVDEFLRNFLYEAGMTRTVGSFDTEWYSSAHRNMVDSMNPAAAFIPDALEHRKLLQGELDRVCRETEKLRLEVQASAESLVSLQRERSFHQLQHQRVRQERTLLRAELEQLKDQLKSYEPLLKQLDDAYREALRQKALLSIQTEKVKSPRDSREGPGQPRGGAGRGVGPMSSTDQPLVRAADSEFPTYSRVTPTPTPGSTAQATACPGSLRLTSSIGAHPLPVSCIDLHPDNHLLASASDDLSWRLWALAARSRDQVGQLMMAGEGHTDWLTGVSFHPDGSKLATTSGDTTVRLWDLSDGRCLLTLSGHSQATWGCSFHSCGLFLASCSGDRCTKLWDLSSLRCRLTLRRHTAVVSSVCFQTASNLLLTSSADKTLALWDARLGVCTASFTGHRHSCSHAAFSPTGDVLASCDSAGVVKLWDLRKAQQEMFSVDSGPSGGNQVAFCRSGKVLAVAGSDGLVRLLDADCQTVSGVSAHCGGVQSVAFGHNTGTLLSAGSDGRINLWSCDQDDSRR